MSHGQASLSTEEQRKRELFLKIRAENEPTHAAEVAAPDSPPSAPRTQPRQQAAPPTRQPAPTPQRVSPRPDTPPANQLPQQNPPLRKNPPQAAPPRESRQRSRTPERSQVIREKIPTARPPQQPQPLPRQQPQSHPRATTVPQQTAGHETPSSTSFGERLKRFAQSTREHLEGLPRTEQSLGTPQAYGLPVSKPRDIRTATTPNVSADEFRRHSPLGPDLAQLKPQTSTTKTVSKAAVARANEMIPGANIDPAETADELAVLDQKLSEARKMTGTAKVAGKQLKDMRRGDDFSKLKIPPFPLIASLEKNIPLPPEPIISERLIDLEKSDVKPAVEQAAPDGKPKHGAGDQEIGAPDKPGAADSPPDTVADDIASLITANTDTTHGPQPVGMSFFERFALGAILASENHLASLTEGETFPVSTVVAPAAPATKADDQSEAKPPKLLDEPDTVKLIENQIPPTHVSPGLDEMVISSTSQTDFDLNDSQMVFSGEVQVKSPRFNLRADKFIVHLKKDNSGLAFGEAVGNVVIELREDGRPTGYSGLASNAIYYPTEGEIVLSGWPKIRQQFKEHVAVTEDTKMILYTDGRVKTLGRNRTIIRK